MLSEGRENPDLGGGGGRAFDRPVTGKGEKDMNEIISKKVLILQ